jgi:DNA-binding transcriptional ArsR family regulator
MVDMPDLAAVASVVGDPTRARMLAQLMDGQAHTATELAIEAEVAASTASFHLCRLLRAGLVSQVRQGRHRYFRIATPQVAAALEGLESIAPERRMNRGPRDERLRFARTCYDHLAGEAAVRLLETLLARSLIAGPEMAQELTREGAAWCARVGIALDARHATRRPLVRTCLDWSERRAHLGGRLGAALLERLFALRFARRIAGSRALALSERGLAFVAQAELVR